MARCPIYTGCLWPSPGRTGSPREQLMSGLARPVTAVGLRLSSFRGRRHSQTTAALLPGTALPGNSKLEAPSPASPRRAAGIGNLKAPAGEQYFCRWQWLRLVLTSGRLQCYLDIVAAPAPAEPPGGARSPSPRSIASPAMGPG